MIGAALSNPNNQNLRYLDISDNPIEDPQYKVLFGILHHNQALLSVEYTLYDEENHKWMQMYKQLQKEQMWTIHEMQHQINEMRHGHGHGHDHHTPLWQKIVFPIWCWKTLIHAKHEAFRFKYEPAAIHRIEKELMPGIKWQLYGWSLIYYVITFVMPNFFVYHECERTFDPLIYIAYGAYLLGNAIWEIYTVLKIQKLAANKKLLSFNAWHFVELIMGMIARTDTFLDILFLFIIANCWETFEPWIIPCLTFASCNLIFPLIMLLRNLKTDQGNPISQPYLESTCFVSFIRENMLLATVVDSFCINNSFYFLGRPLVFGKLMGFVSFFTQDFPQLTLHVLFKLIILNESQAKLKKQYLLTVGMTCSSFAVLISIFNMVMCTQNEFDPIVLETELVSRREKYARELAASRETKLGF